MSPEMQTRSMAGRRGCANQSGHQSGTGEHRHSTTVVSVARSVDWEGRLVAFGVRGDILHKTNPSRLIGLTWVGWFPMPKRSGEQPSTFQFSVRLSVAYGGP